MRQTSWSQITIDSHNGKLVWWEAEKKKEEFYYALLEKDWRPVKIDPELKKKPNSIPGFETSLSGQNAIALPLVPPPLPHRFSDSYNPFVNLLLTDTGDE